VVTQQQGEFDQAIDAYRRATASDPGHARAYRNLGSAFAAEGGAAVLSNLDLVIATCTSATHLAGALGRPVWIALKHVPDWCWLLDREDSPW
jgi:hypothetical protein